MEKFRIKYPKLFKVLRDTKTFFLIFLIVFVLVFGVFNGRAFLNQTKYSLKIGIENSQKFMNRIEGSKEEIYNTIDRVVIPKINVDAPIILPDSSDEKTIFNNLEKGVVLYPSSVIPGQIGNSILLGHSSAYPWYKGNYGSVFSLLNRLEAGNQIIVFYSKNKHVYEIIGKQVILKDVSIQSQDESSRLILISCWPVGTAWKRIMIIAEKVE